MRIKALQWSARRCDCCQGEVLGSVVGVQLQSKVDGVTGNLAKSQATRRKLRGGLRESLRGGIVLLSGQVGNLSKIVNKSVLS